MIVYFCKLYSKWLLAISMALLPYLGIEAATNDLPADEMSSIETSHQSFQRVNSEAVRVQLLLLLVNNTIYFHDVILSETQSFPPEILGDNFGLLFENSSALGEALYPQDLFAAEQFTNLFNSYLSAGLKYVADLTFSGNPNDPVVVADFQLWLILANQVSATLNQLNPKVIKLQKIQNLFIEYTTLLANIANNLVVTPTTTPNFTLASYLYSQAREVSEEISALLAKGVVASLKH